jgi:hypothetical protein
MAGPRSAPRGGCHLISLNVSGGIPRGGSWRRSSKDLRTGLASGNVCARNEAVDFDRAVRLVPGVSRNLNILNRSHSIWIANRLI